MEKWCGCVSCKVCKWHSHLGKWLMVEKMWLCGLQSLQLTQPLGRWQKSDVAVWVAKFATDTATWWMADGRKDVAVWAAKFASDTATVKIRDILMDHQKHWYGCPHYKTCSLYSPKTFWPYLRACPGNAMWQVPTHQISWFYANMSQSYACCPSYPMYLVFRPP